MNNNKEDQDAGRYHNLEQIKMKLLRIYIYEYNIYFLKMYWDSNFCTK